MKTHIFLIIIFSLSFLGDTVAQDELKDAEVRATKRDTKVFAVLSLDGKAENIMIVPNYAEHILKIKASKDSIMIDDFWGVPPDIKLLGKSFISVSYAVRGGSNLGLGNGLLVCVKEGKLYETIHALRSAEWDTEGSKSNYHIKWSLQGSNQRDFKLAVDIHDEAYSKSHPDENYVYSDRTILNFDSKRNAFYSIKISKYNMSIKTKAGKQKVGGNFPTILLGKEAYYLVDRKWYQIATANEFQEFQ